ncbi:S-layer homology domain-containing protein [Paenibacillus sp. FSL L8-0463]|uniref:S-layer homology domain-containing protein n=1 Tax=Paenibacillus sp. FSL L8-0463 TaxID=2954687 RepID=UPI00311A64C9
MAIVMVLTMMPFYPLEVRAAVTPTLDLGNPVRVTGTTYQLSNATFGSTGVVNGAGGYFTVAVNNGSTAVGTLPSGITELINGIKISNIVTDKSTSANRVFNFSNSNTYEEILTVIRNMTFTQAVGQTQKVTVNVAPGAPLTDGKTSVRTYNGRYFVYVQRQGTMTFKDAVTIATNNHGHLLEPKSNNPQEIFTIASMFEEFTTPFGGNWSFLTFIGATKTTAPNWNTSIYGDTKYVSNGLSTGLEASKDFVPNGAYDHLTLLLDTTNNKVGYLAVNNTHGGSSVYFDPGVIVEYNSGVISNSITATKTIVLPEMGGSVGISGVAKVGQTLTADLSGVTYTPGTTDNVPTYQWYRNGVAITNAKGSSYTLTADDFGAAITVMVAADDTHATGSVTSAATGAVTAADGAAAPAAPVEVSKTATSIVLQAVTGQEYSIDGGVTWQDSPTFSGLTPDTDYTIVTRVKATATQQASASSTGTSIRTAAKAIVLPEMGGSVGISGVAKVGQTLTADLSGVTYTPGTTDNVPTYQWYRNGVAITNAKGSSYTLTADDFGAAITVMVAADDTHATGSLTSAATGAVTAADSAAAPAAPVEVSKTATSITLKAVTGQEYSIDGGVTWQDSPTFSGLTPDTDYTIVTRVKATATQQASAASTGTSIRTAADNADLNGLMLSSGTLSPVFAAGTTNYTTSVPNGVSDTTVTATVVDSVYATVTASVYNSEGTLVKGPITLTSGVASDSLPLSVGINTIKTVVTAQDGTTQTYIVTVTRDPRDDSGTNGGPIPTPAPTSAPATASGVKTTVNNEDSGFATGTTANNLTAVVIDPGKLSAHLSKGNGQQLNILVPGDGEIKVAGLTAATLKQLSDTGSTLNIENLLAIYPMPSTQLDLDSITKQWNGAPLGQIAVDINIKRSSDALKAAAKDQAAKGGYDLLVNPVDLSLNFTYQNQSVKPDQLTDYAPRYIALPEGIDPNKITTGVIVNPDGTVFHVPTVVTKINNRYFALINDLRSQGSYSVIWNPQNFDDVKSHWAQESVNNIAARLQLEGTGNNTFSPNRSIDRSEFATIVASGLGLMRQGVSGTPYSDVAPSSWYHDAVKIASEFGIIKGFEDGGFHGSEQITREQGIAMIARSLQVVQPQEALSTLEINQILAPYSDMDQISGYARESVAQLIKAGILQGIGKQQLNPKAAMTRAETAAMIERLLKATKLID